MQCLVDTHALELLNLMAQHMHEVCKCGPLINEHPKEVLLLQKLVHESLTAPRFAFQQNMLLQVAMASGKTQPHNVKQNVEGKCVLSCSAAFLGHAMHLLGPALVDICAFEISAFLLLCDEASEGLPATGICQWRLLSLNMCLLHAEAVHK